MKFYLGIFIFSFSLFSQQNAKIVYRVVQDTTQCSFDTGDKMVDRSLKERSKRVYEVAKDLEYILKFNAIESIYRLDEPMRDESVGMMDFMMAKLLGGVDVYYQNARERIRIQQYYENGKSICELDSINQKWQITEEIGKIGEYKVIKAVFNNTEAWFTPDIPVPFGPMGYGGLPGLILKIQFKMRIIVVDKIIFSRKNIKIKRPDGEIKSAEEMKKKRLEELIKRQQRIRR